MTVMVGQVMVSESVALSVHPLVSVMLTVKLKLPAAIGVPLSVPLLASESPLGNADPTASAKL